MVAVLVILDGASEPPRDGEPTSLELARTPALDRLAREGELARLRTIAPGLSPGSEVAIPALPGWTPPAGVDRGALEAAAHGIEVPDGERAWRVDAAGPAAARGREAARIADGAAGAVARGGDVAAELRAAAPGHAVHPLGGHRLVLVGSAPLPDADRALVGPLAGAVARAGATIAVCPDHGCDPATGEHDATPVPRVTWPRARATRCRELVAVRRLTERRVAHLPESALDTAAPAGALA